MALGALGAVLAPAPDEMDHLLALDLVDHLGLHAGVFHQRRADLRAHHQDLVELDLVTSFGRKLLDAQDIAGRYPVLLATGLQDRKHLIFLHVPRSSAPDRVLLPRGAPSCAPFSDVCFQ